MKVIIYSLVDVVFYSFYIEGFYKIYGKSNVSFSCNGFPSFGERKFAAIVDTGEKKLNIVIDAFDSARIWKDQLSWCDVYGKVNYNEECLPEDFKGKIIPIGPSFGAKIWNFQETLAIAFFNFQKSREQITNKKEFFANYWRQYKRVRIKSYKRKKPPVDNYIFFISSLWAKEEETNATRSAFITACRELPHVKFEGGFAPRSDGNKLGYTSFIDTRFSLKDYIMNIQKSILVFNTPTVVNCHGWKLAEYLALGKAIITTDHVNQLPEPLLHGKHVHYVLKEKQSMKEAIEEIRCNDEYRIALEANARLYFERNLSPEVVLQKLIASAENLHKGQKSYSK